MSKTDRTTKDDFLLELKSINTIENIFNQCYQYNSCSLEKKLDVFIDQNIGFEIIRNFLLMPNYQKCGIDFCEFEDDNATDIYKVLEDKIIKIIISQTPISSKFITHFQKSKNTTTEYTMVSPKSIFFGDEQNELLKINQIAGQKQLTYSPDLTRALNHFNNYLSLGQLRSDFAEAEVILRNSDILDFNLNSIRQDQNRKNPNAPLCGLSIEEACMLMKYAGSSSKLRVINIHGFELKDFDLYSQSDLIGHLLWYFMDGIQFRTDQNFINKKEYLIDTSLADVTFRFLEDQDSGKWFVNFPEAESEVFSCNEKDYEMAKNNKISPRIMKLLSQH